MGMRSAAPDQQTATNDDAMPDSVGAAMVNGGGPGWLKAESRDSAEMGPQAERCLTPAIDV